MQAEPIPGQSYRIMQCHPTHKGRTGVASYVERLGRGWWLTLSNIREWGAAGIATEVRVLSSEIEPAQPLHPAPSPQTPALATDAFDGSEHELVAQITKALERAGYCVAVVGQLKAKGSGTTTGYPDMSVRRPTWPRGMACLLEIKTAAGTLLPEQETFHEQGWMHVVRSEGEALRLLNHFEIEQGLLGGVR